MAAEETRGSRAEGEQGPAAPSISLPKGGGAIRGIGEKFAANPVTGTGSVSVPIATSPGRSGFAPQLALAYDSGAGNGPFGFGWALSLPAITRKTEKGLPQYRDATESDVFILSGAEDLVPDTRHAADTTVAGFTIDRYCPRIEGAFARIERWTRQSDGDVHWRSITRDNLLTLYGTDAHSRICDPADPGRIFSWLICETRGDKGNAVIYEYKPEDGAGVDLTHAHERNRGDRDDARRTANRYLKRIRYGNRVPLLDSAGQRPRFLTADQRDPAGWLFEVVFDYGEHDAVAPMPDDAGQWAYRDDSFSSYRAGFEVRSCRLCQRVLMFHHFALEAGVGNNCLVRSTDFTYAPEQDPANSTNPGYRFLSAVTQTGYKRHAGAYLSSSLPPVAFTYSQPVVQERVETVAAESLENLPIGMDGAAYQWLDLHGEGLSGILTEQAGAWFYKRNLSPVSERPVAFAPLEQVAARPNLSLSGGQPQFMDLAGDGRPDLVVLDGPMRGLYEHDNDEGWQPFRAFTSPLTRDMHDPNLRLVDLDGDGHADVLITEQDSLVWHPSLGEAGFGPGIRVPQALDEETGPRLVFADGAQSLYLADMSGDGLTDLVRIRNGEVCYWPNLGYCHFGAKVAMDQAPWFDSPDQFDQQRIRLADIDGSGSTDIIYLHRDGVRLYFNQSGNSWSAPQPLHVFPRVDNVGAIAAVDLLGNGTACLVWSSPLPGDTGRQLRYVDLMGGSKPHLLVRTVNNMGAETRIQYAPSTRFYIADRLAGKPWITRLPFPVHVVEQVERRDYISRNRFVTRYAYHHGYFDGEEREFRGFGMVEQWDTEAYEDYVVGVAHFDGAQELAPELNQPPVTTRTWYHTGALLGRDRLLHQCRDEYYPELLHLAEPALPAGLDDQEFREALRTLKGLPLRQEVYSFDGSAQAAHPYSIRENSFEIRRLQPRGHQKHAVFFAVGRETLSLSCERNPAEPRVAHTLDLAVDEYGNVRQSCAVVYGRQVADPALPPAVTRDQQAMYITYAETDYTPDLDREHPTPAYRLRVPYESRSYEITGLAPAAGLFQIAEINTLIAGAAEVAYEIVADGMTGQKRLLSHGRTLFLDNSLHPRPLGQWDSLGIVHQSYQLAFTPGLISNHYAGKVTDAEFAAAGYMHWGGDANWWIPSATAIFPANPADHFYMPVGVRDPAGLETVATPDAYDLLVARVQVKQAGWIETTAVNDYRILGPVAVTDPNQNRSAVETDVLGLVVKSAVMGKAGSGDGDSLDNPTVRMEYDLFNWMQHGKPNFVHTFVREQHGAANPRWQESYTYLNGRGGTAMVKEQAHPGKALTVNPDGTVAEVAADPRWLGNGRTVLNNKGNAVKQYEPYFSSTHEYEDERTLREIGASPILYYDALGRNVRTLFPSGTLAKVAFDPWMQCVSDPNDTVRESRWYAERGSPDPATEPEPVSDPERRAAWLAAKHADTPRVAHFDSLGRPICTIADYGGGMAAAVRSETDLTGRYSRMFDQAGRQVGSGVVSMAGTPIVGASAEKGRRWIFHNILGALVKSWDEHGRAFRADYDELQRPLSTYVQETGQPEILFDYIVYGDRHPGAAQLNLLGTVHQTFDQAGVVRVAAVDFKGNPVRVERILATEYKRSLDWTALRSQADYAALQTAAGATLNLGEVFATSSQYDALNRPTQVTLPDGTVILPTYSEANFLTSLQVRIRGQGAFVEFLKGQDYDAKGQRQFVQYGNDVITRYFYDANTFRLVNLLTYKLGDDPGTRGLQNLHYSYDPVGNMTQCRDDAQQTHYFRNSVVKPESLYEYDAIYQLIRATGREHAGLGNSSARTHADLDFVPQLPHVNDSAAVRTYREEYEYDLLGNLKLLRHRFQPQAGLGSGWTRGYRYAYENDPADATNRLAATSLPGDPDAGPFSAAYAYDPYGNMTRMPHLADMAWNFLDQLRSVDLGGGGTAYYVYDTGGQRIRQVIERQGGRRIERIYLGAVELYRERLGDSSPQLERETLHIVDNGERIAQVDIKLTDVSNVDPTNPLAVPLIRYQYGNHLGSATLETDANGAVISYEEYHPYGTSAYRSEKPGFDLSLKRYRFSGKERDSETGLYCFGLRYYAPWLGRWTSSDPAGFVGGFNLFRYCANNPIMLIDPDGTKEWRTDRTVWDTLATGGDNGGAVDTGPEFERWARQQGIEYEGTPTFSGGNWTVGRYRMGEPGQGGPRESLSAAQSPQPPGEGPAPPAAGPPPAQAPAQAEVDLEAEAPAAQSPQTPGGGGGGGGSGSGESGGRSFFTSSFFKGLVVGLVVTVAVVAVVATGGAALAVIAPAASAAIAASGVGTALAVAGGAVAVASTVQSVRQRDLWNNAISEEQANYNLGLGIGSALGGAVARPVAGAGAALGQRLGQGVNGAAEALASGGGQFALASGGSFGNAVTVAPAAGVTTTSAVTAAGTAMGTDVLMMAGHEADWELRDSNGRIATRGHESSGSDTPPGRRLSWDEQLAVHTERKILAQLGGKVQPGQTITIRGTKPPCDPGGRGCGSAMRAFAQKYGVNIVYRNTTTGQTWRYP